MLWAGPADPAADHLRGTAVTAARDRLGAAYAATSYRVDAGPRGRFAIRIGEPSPGLDALLAAAGVETWAFVTAANPGSVRLADADNAARMARLLEAVRGRRLVHYPGTGTGDDRTWPAEPSLLVLGLDTAEAVALARRFGQVAIVAGRRGGVAGLVWVDEQP